MAGAMSLGDLFPDAGDGEGNTLVFITVGCKRQSGAVMNQLVAFNNGPGFVFEGADDVQHLWLTEGSGLSHYNHSSMMASMLT